MVESMSDKREKWLTIWNAVINAKINYKTGKLNVSTNAIVKKAHIRKQVGLEWIRKAKAAYYLREKGVPIKEIVNHFKKQGIPIKETDLKKVKPKENYVRKISKEVKIKDKEFKKELIKEKIQNEIIGIDAHFNPKTVKGGEEPWKDIIEMYS
jgi:hypothetical protein